MDGQIIDSIEGQALVAGLWKFPLFPWKMENKEMKSDSAYPFQGRLRHSLSQDRTGSNGLGFTSRFQNSHTESVDVLRGAEH
jgi:hypothetical protein